MIKKTTMKKCVRTDVFFCLQVQDYAGQSSIGAGEDVRLLSRRQTAMARVPSLFLSVPNAVKFHRGDEHGRDRHMPSSWLGGS